MIKLPSPTLIAPLIKILRPASSVRLPVAFGLVIIGLLTVISLFASRTRDVPVFNTLVSKLGPAVTVIADKFANVKIVGSVSAIVTDPLPSPGSATKNCFGSMRAETIRLVLAATPVRLFVLLTVPVTAPVPPLQVAAPIPPFQLGLEIT